MLNATITLTTDDGKGFRLAHQDDSFVVQRVTETNTEKSRFSPMTGLRSLYNMFLTCPQAHIEVLEEKKLI